MKHKALTLICCLFGLSAIQAQACEICSVYSASRLQKQESGAITLALTNESTDYKRSKHYVENSQRYAELTQNYSTTQLTLGYGINEKAGLQLLLPFVYRTFDKIDNYRVSRESESGLGDATATLSYSILNWDKLDYSIDTDLFGGVKFPSGDAGSLSESGAEEPLLRHHTVSGAAGGHALSIGSGSFDFPLGVLIRARSNRLLFRASAQYTIRTEGSFDYHYADDFVWYAGPGYYLSLDDKYSVSSFIIVSGEHKPLDTHAGELVEDSDISDIYVGPQLLGSFGTKWNAELSADTRVSQDNTYSIIPEYRIRAGLAYRF